MADEATPKKKSKLKWIILIILLLAMGGGGAAAWFFLLKDNSPDTETAGEPAKTEQVQKAEEPRGGVEVPLAQFMTNLADPLGQRFIRMTVVLRVSDQKVEADLTAQNARIRDSVIMLLSSKTYADIARTESKLLLKSELMDRLNTILGAGKVYDVYITDLVVQ